MKLLFIGQGRFVQFPNNVVYHKNNIFTYSYFQRYLEVFDEVNIVSRVWQENVLTPQYIHASTGPGISFVGIPPFISVRQYIRFLPRIRKIINQAVSEADAFILRVPNYFSFLARREIHRRGLPYAVEVVGDPRDAFQPGAVEHPLRPLIRLLSSHELRQTCAQASAASYVTKFTLQKRYPPRNDAFTTHYSTIDLPAPFFLDKPRYYTVPATQLVFVGTLEVMYKAPDVLLNALKILTERGIFLKLGMVGDGRCCHQLEGLVEKFNLAEQVVFHGKVPNQEVFTILNGADLFVLPSKQEGLPRAMIEAMARGLPCIGSTAGGIPELLPPEDLVPPGDAVALADKIIAVAGNPERLTRMSARNLAEAQKYRGDVLGAKRREFYRYVREISE